MKNENYNSEIGITGIGVVSSLGHGYSNFADAVIQSQSGIKTISVFDSLSYDRKLAGEVNDLDLGLYLPKKGKRYMDRSIKFVCAAANMAIEDAKLEINDLNKHRIGVIGSTTFGNLKSISDFYVESLTEEFPMWVNPMDFPKTTINSAASNISIIIGAMGYNTTLLGGYTSSMDVISHGINLLRMNMLDAVLVCSVEDLNEQSFLHHNVLGCLAGSSAGNERIAPFDKSGSGYILGEGAVVFVLERVNDVINKDRQMRVKIKSIGQGFDSSPNYSYFNMPKPDRITSVIRKTLEKAGLSTRDICLISTSANGCVEFDTSEADALSKVFSDHDPSVVSVKSKIGETVSAGGAFATVLATAVIEKQKAPYILNLSDPVVPLNYVVEKPRELKVENALVTSIDPCGNCMGMIISRN
jgi:3-oxoacyl-[acyl-carrier-protein] synthase II